jgi:hypothetical protein
MAQDPGVRRSDKPLTVWNTNWWNFFMSGGPAPRWVERATGSAEDRRPHAAVAPVHTSVTRVKTPMSPTFHLLMTLFTCGGWFLLLVPYVIIHAMSRGRKVKTTYR